LIKKRKEKKPHLRDLTPETSLEKQCIRNLTPPKHKEPHSRDLTAKTSYYTTGFTLQNLTPEISNMIFLK